MFPLPTSRQADCASDAEIADDPDWAEFEPIDWSRVEVVVPANKVEDAKRG